MREMFCNFLGNKWSILVHMQHKCITSLAWTPCLASCILVWSEDSTSCFVLSSNQSHLLMNNERKTPVTYYILNCVNFSKHIVSLFIANILQSNFTAWNCFKIWCLRCLTLIVARQYKIRVIIKLESWLMTMAQLKFWAELF